MRPAGIRMPQAVRSPGALGMHGASVLYGLGLLSVIQGVSLVALAGALANGIVSVMEGRPASGWVTLGLIAAITRAGAHWVSKVWAARAAIGVKESLRTRLAERAMHGDVGSAGDLAVLATRGLDDLDEYFGTVLPAVMSAAVIPLLVGLRILSVDWVSALIVLITMPFVPIFMALIGMRTRDGVEAASDSLGRLSDHLVELARGLPVLVGLGRAEEQAASLEEVSDQYRQRTMKTLRVAFLSSLALELISTISIAVVAVFIGFRLIDGSLPLEVGLLVLVLAPECFAPLRDMGAAFHASQDGRAALNRVRSIIDRPVSWSFVAEPERNAISVEGLAVRHEGRDDPAVHDLSFSVPRGTITALVGPSGSGKSSTLLALAGIHVEGARIEGRIGGVDSRRVAWLPQHPRTVGDTVADELALYAASGMPVDGALRAVDLEWAAQLDPASLSPGELRRLAVARVLMRVDAGADVVLLDEPTAHLDAGNARLIEAAIGMLQGHATVIVASHEAPVVALASQVVPVGAARKRPHGHTGGAAATGASVGTPIRCTTADPATAGAEGCDDSGADAVVELPALAGSRSIRILLSLVRPVAGRLLLATILGVLAALFAIALTAVSGWLIVRASQQPAIMYLLVAIVGVRFFGIGRSVVRYAERLLTHDAVFVSITGLRTRLWRALAARGASSRRLLRGGTALDLLVATADEVRDLAPRVLLPPIVGLISAGVVIVAAALLWSGAVPLLVVAVVICLLAAPAAAVRADRRASANRQLARSSITRRFAAMLAASADLRANGVDDVVRNKLQELDARAGMQARRGAWAFGLGGGIVVAVMTGTAALMVAITATAVAEGSLADEILAVLVLVPLGLIDPLLRVVDAVQQWPSFLQAARRLARFADTGEPVSASRGTVLPSGALNGATDDVIDRVELRRLAARWPGAAASAFHGVDFTAVQGDWLVVTGPSGSGKSTLLTLMLGYIPPESGKYMLGGRDSRELDPTTLRRHIAWCPQDAHVFDSSLRANLLLGRPRDDRPSEAEMLEAITRAGLGPAVSRMPQGLDTRIGSEGSRLSGGERQRLAVARTLLSRAEVVLLDEPTAHLDTGTAAALMFDLRMALRDRITVLVTHRDADIEPHDIRLELGSFGCRELPHSGRRREPEYAAP